MGMNVLVTLRAARIARSLKNPGEGGVKRSQDKPYTPSMSSASLCRAIEAGIATDVVRPTVTDVKQPIGKGAGVLARMRMRMY